MECASADERERGQHRETSKKNVTGQTAASILYLSWNSNEGNYSDRLKVHALIGEHSADVRI
jgi:hypothetical protein